MQALQNSDAEVRSDAAEALGLIDVKGAAPALIQALQDQDSWVRAAATEALLNIGTPEALKAVEEYQSRQ